MVNVQDLSSGVASPFLAQPAGPGKTPASASSAPAVSASGTERLSPLARQLSEAALRADARDSTLAGTALAEKAEKQLGQITGDGYFTLRTMHDRAVPGSNDPATLARAKQATEFTHDRAENPFKGLSREQLALVAYDDSGTFTVNERRAAWSEAYDQEQAWRQKVVAQAMQEWNETGKQTHFFKSVLEHFQSLPKIEQAQYGQDYAARLQARIAEDKSADRPATLDDLTVA